MLCKLFVDISNNDFDKIVKVNWKGQIESHQIRGNPSKLKRDYWVKVNKQLASLKIWKDAVKTIDKDISEQYNIEVNNASDKPYENSTNNEEWNIKNKSVMNEISGYVAEKNQRLDIMSIKVANSLSQEELNGIYTKLTKWIEIVKRWNSLESLIKTNVEEWIKR